MGFCYVPTYPEDYFSSYTKSYSYGKKKKEDGLLETLLKVIGGIIDIVGLFIVNILLDIRNFVKENPWVTYVVDGMSIVLAGLALVYSASWILVAIGILEVVDLIISIATLDFSIVDVADETLENYYKKKKIKETTYRALKLLLEIADVIV